MHINFHEDWFWQSGNIKVITSKIWEAAVLILLMGRIHGVCRWDGLRWHDILTKSNADRFRHSSNIKGITSTIWEAILLVLLMRDLWCTPLKWAQVAWYTCTYQVSWRSVQAFKYHYGYYSNNLRGCNVGITDRRDLWSSQLRYLHVAWYTYQVSWRLIMALK
jgi:hypothetical protein